MASPSGPSSETSSDNPDTSLVTMSIVDYPSSPGVVRHRRQVTWSTTTDDQQSHASCDPDLDLQTDDDHLSVDELETSPSMVRRRREQLKRRRRRRQKERIEEERLPAASTDELSASVSTQLLRTVEDSGDQDLATLDEIPAAIGGTSVQNGDLSFQTSLHGRELKGGSEQPQPFKQHHATTKQKTPAAVAAAGVAEACEEGRPAGDHPASNPASRAASFRNFDLPGRGKSRDAPATWLPFNISIWMSLCLALLLLSNVLFLVAFVTQAWGRVDITQTTHGDPVATPGEDVSWNFGLWRCCRDDGVCLGTRWPVFYSACRTFAVLALFGQALSFSLIFGHAVEKLLDYDPCTMLTLVSCCFITAAFVTINVSVYGAMWPTAFRQILQHADINSTTSLGYSFYLAVASAPLLLASGVLALVDLNSSRKAFQVRRAFAEVFDDDDDDDEYDVSYNFDVINGLYFHDKFLPDGGVFADDLDRARMPYLDRSSLWHEESLM